MKKHLKTTKTAIYSPWGIKIEQCNSGNDLGRLFIFSSINPSVEFRQVLSKLDRLQIAWFLIRSTFKSDPITAQPKGETDAK